MPALSDARREFFAKEIAKGTPAYRAAIKAGYSKHTATKANAQLRKGEIAARIGELHAQAADRERLALARAAQRYDVTTERVIGELARIGFANALDYIKIGDDGAPRYDLASISRDQGAAIQEIIIDEYKDGKGDDARDVRRIRLKLADKRAALVDLGRHLGLFVDPSVLNVNVANYFSEAPPSMAEWRHEIEATAIEAPSTGKATGQIEAPSKKRVASKR